MKFSSDQCRPDELYKENRVPTTISTAASCDYSKKMSAQLWCHSRTIGEPIEEPQYVPKHLRRQQIEKALRSSLPRRPEIQQ